jgi:hypothetical protein
LKSSPVTSAKTAGAAPKAKTRVKIQLFIFPPNTDILYTYL